MRLICIMKNSMETGSHQRLVTDHDSTLTIRLMIMPSISSCGTDDGHRVVLKSFSDGMDCEHDYINATYIDVRSPQNILKFLSQTTGNSTS